MKKLLFILFITAFGQIIAQNNYRFRNYTINDGLSQSAITTIIQDDIGTLWIGTQDGLNRFDGQSFENFTSDKIEGIENEMLAAGEQLKLLVEKRTGETSNLDVDSILESSAAAAIAGGA